MLSNEQELEMFAKVIRTATVVEGLKESFALAEEKNARDHASYRTRIGKNKLMIVGLALLLTGLGVINSPPALAYFSSIP